ncbi:MAG: hypothetical protein ACXABY_22555 [Candidatus Thorarchaeota archaeon]|jgi:hypothetical protein
MAEKQEAANDGGDRPGKTPNKHTSTKHKQRKELNQITRRPAEQDAQLIIAQAYQEAARIIAEAKERVQHITGEGNERDMAIYRLLSELGKSSKLTGYSYEQIDDLFVRTRHCLAKIAQIDQSTVDELANLIAHVEYWVESLVVDSLKLRSLERWLQGTTELAKRLRDELDRE